MAPSRPELLQQALELQDMREVRRRPNEKCPSGMLIPGLSAIIRMLESGNQQTVDDWAPIWRIIKHCHHLISIKQTFSRGPPPKIIRQQLRKQGLSGKELNDQSHIESVRNKVPVDAVVNGGKTWLKIYSITEQRLVQDMTEKGWEFLESHDSNAESNSILLENPVEELELIERVRHLVDAAKSNPFEYSTPDVVLVLPRMAKTRFRDIDAVFHHARQIGEDTLRIELSDSDFCVRSPPPWQDALGSLLGNDLECLTQTVVLEYSLLVLLASDITHNLLFEEPWYVGSLMEQITEERKHRGKALSLLYPALESRDIVCTRESADHLRRCLETLGTPRQVERMNLLLDDGPYSLSPEERWVQYAKLSDHTTPSSLRLPIRVISHNSMEPFASGKLPDRAAPIIQKLRDTTGSTFIYAWATGSTIITCNKQLTSTVRNMLRPYDCGGPSVWLCPVSRSIAPNGKLWLSDDMTEPNQQAQRVGPDYEDTSSIV